MEEAQYEFRNGIGSAGRFNRWAKVALHDGSACITDMRVAQLLIVLSEIDETVAHMGGMPEGELRGLVSAAIRACGFSDPEEVRWVLSSVLKAIDPPQAHWMHEL